MIVLSTEELYCLNSNFIFLTTKGSNLVPPDNSTGVIAVNRDSLMWLNSFEGLLHDVYMGTSRDALMLQGTTVGENNVLKLRAPLDSGRQYFWRVDAKISKEVTYKGDVWTFKTGDLKPSLGQNGMLVRLTTVLLQ